ncbi:MAG: hypothetical protein SOZ97_03310 [Lachnospiraceae bacterium]|nr:hypothetical protein [Lachnospiraceae bacterium]
MILSKEKKQEYFFHISAIILIILLCCVNIRRLDYIAVLNDEFGYWSTAASIAGYDWTSLISETPYYSWGYSILLVPIILIFPTPEVWYKAAIGLNIVFLIGSYFLCIAIGKKWFSVKYNNKIIFIASLIAIIYPSNITYAQVAWSETLLIFLMWLATYLMISLEEHFTYLKLIVEIFVFVYMYVVHVRSIGIIIVGILSLFFIIIKNKKSMVVFAGVLIFFVIGYLLNNVVKQYQITEFWANSNISNINNVAIDGTTISTYLYRVLSSLRLLIESFGAKLIYLLVGTGFTLFIVIVQFSKEIFYNFRKKKLLTSNCIGKFFCVFASIAMLGLCSLQMLNWQERKDIIVYARYMENAIGPIIFMGVMYSVIFIKSTRVGVIISALLFAVGIKSVYWRIERATGYFNSICSPVFGAFYDFCYKDVKKTIILIAVLSCFLVVVYYISTFIKSNKVRYSLVLLVMVAYYIFIGNKAGIYMNDARQYFDSNTVPIMREIRQNYNDTTVYYVKNVETDPYSVNPKYLQYMIPNISILLVEQKDLCDIWEEGIVILTNPKDLSSEEYMKNKKDDVYKIQETSMLNMYVISSH